MGMGIGWLFWIVLIVVLVIAIGWSRSNRRRTDRGSNDSALAILKERYAKGEIGKAEFEEKRRELSE